MASKFSSFFAELKRRKVYHIAAVYAAVGAAISLAVPDLFSAFDLPNSAARLVIILIVLGFPIALILAWAYEVKPEEGRPGEASAEEATPDLAARPTEDPRPSVAVLPFANLSAGPSDFRPTIHGSWRISAGSTGCRVGPTRRVGCSPSWKRNGEKVTSGRSISPPYTPA